MASEQTLKNHARIIPLYHYVTLGILVLNFLWTGYRAVTRFGPDALMAWLVSIALVLLFFYARVFALTVQNRVIRLEMRLRLRESLPPDLVARIGDLTVGQLVALRFASDAELPSLVRQVLDERLTDRKAIKKLIRHWQADHLRA